MNVGIKFDIIEEKIENSTVKDIINIFYSNNVKSNEGKLLIDYETVGKQNGFSKELCRSLYGTKNFSTLYIYYKNEKIPIKYKIIEIEDLSKKKELYHIYRYKYCSNLIINEKKFKNPLIIADKTIYTFDKLEKIFSTKIKMFKIIDSEIIDFSKMFPKAKGKEKTMEIEEEEINPEEIIGLSYSENFEYYFKYPKCSEKFIYEYSTERTDFSNIGDEEKITAICGNFGIGKSTSFLSARMENKEIIYLNLKTLIKNKDETFIWKYKILLKEIAFTFKRNSSYEKFIELKKEIEEALFIWECIKCVVNFVIKENIKTKLIIDQYKELYDSNFENIKEIIKIINYAKNDIIKLIISSSINNKDVRNCLLKSWFPHRFKEIPVFIYIYFSTLFDSENIIKEDTTLNEKKKKMIKNSFNNIPKFYYEIKYIEEDKLDKYEIEQLKKVENKIKDFYKTNDISMEQILTILNFRPKIGKIITEEEELFNILKLLPLKYFTFNENKINYYFPLVEKAFENFLTEKVRPFLNYPPIGIKESSIGDLLEYVLINDLKNSEAIKFDEIFKVDSIWDLKTVESANIDNIENKIILILESNPSAKAIDFGILNKNDELILIQCKKAIARAPYNHPTKELIFQSKNRISGLFNKKFNVKIKMIYLIYITGIALFNNNQVFRTWGNKENESFNKIEEICEKAKCPLIYYNPPNKNFYIKMNKESFQHLNSLLNFSKIIKGVAVESDINKNKREIQYDIFSNQSIYEYKQKLERIRLFNDVSDKFFEMQDYPKIRLNNIQVDTNIFGVCEKPELEDFGYKNVFIGFKRDNKKYLCIEEKNKKRKLYELSKDNLVEIDTKLSELVTGKDINKCYYMHMKK